MLHLPQNVWFIVCLFPVSTLAYPECLLPISILNRVNFKRVRFLEINFELTIFPITVLSINPYTT